MNGNVWRLIWVWGGVTPRLRPPTAGSSSILLLLSLAAAAALRSYTDSDNFDESNLTVNIM